MKTDKKTREELKLLAGKLPLMYELDEYGNIKMRLGTFKHRGSALLKDNPKMKDASGKKLDPHKMYKVKLPVKIDHFKEIIHAYEVKGQAGVEDYCKSMIAAFKKVQTPAYKIKLKIKNFQSNLLKLVKS